MYNGMTFTCHYYNTGCTNEIAITVVMTILIECLLAAPVIAAVAGALYWKKSPRYSHMHACSP